MAVALEITVSQPSDPTTVATSTSVNKKTYILPNIDPKTGTYIGIAVAIASTFLYKVVEEGNLKKTLDLLNANNFISFKPKADINLALHVLEIARFIKTWYYFQRL